MSKVALVTGFTGYIALHIVKQLLEKSYTVIGTVRSSAKGDHYKSLFNNKNLSYEVVSEIAQDHAFDHIFQKHPEIDYVFHVASPFRFDITDVDKEVIQPAIKGTTGILESVKKYGPNVKRVLVTSSYCANIALYDHLDHKETVVTEKDESRITLEEGLKDPLSAYWASKSLACKAAWEFVKNEKPSFELVTVNPGYVYGPQVFPEFDGTLATSVMMVVSLLDLDPTKEWVDDRIEGSIIDVRTVATAHINAAEIPEAGNDRFLLTNGKFARRQFLYYINKNFPQFNLPKVELGDANDINCAAVDSSYTDKVLGLKHIPAEVTIVDAVQQFLDSKK